MPIVSLADAKTHLRVDGSAEDGFIELLLGAAEDAVARYLNRPVPWRDTDGTETPVPAAVKVAVLLILGDLYANREASVVGATVSANPTVDRLLWPHRVVCIA